jgi:hypothetical protein
MAEALLFCGVWLEKGSYHLIIPCLTKWPYYIYLQIERAGFYYRFLYVSIVVSPVMNLVHIKQRKNNKTTTNNNNKKCKGGDGRCCSSDC